MFFLLEHLATERAIIHKHRKIRLSYFFIERPVFPPVLVVREELKEVGRCHRFVSHDVRFSFPPHRVYSSAFR
ncbi:hypothetical protein JT323_gp02 [Proteus phage PM87]|uniref:Uncharacterized protein n=1 Tax=Proteus phage PM87 TaxID=2048007 RepID=A0A2H4PR92_9CAUD|nr:hypothetical protein JT323_gp02 [Proteus phage PM87]ATW69828.1 hypothetical protein [Proteus phage PM87]